MAAIAKHRAAPERDAGDVLDDAIQYAAVVAVVTVLALLVGSALCLLWFVQPVVAIVAGALVAAGVAVLVRWMHTSRKGQ